MRPVNRFTGVISYAGLDEKKLWDDAGRAFASQSLPERFRGFLPLFPMELIVNMPYTGPAPFASPEGFSMRAAEYHRVLSQELPALYQAENRARCFDANGQFSGGVVTVDEAWAEMFPQYRPFMGDKLMLHMIGGGTQAVAVPVSIFPRFGGVLSRIERETGIRERCRHYASFLRARVAPGAACDHDKLEAEYLRQTGLNALRIRQKDLQSIVQESAILRELEGPENRPAPPRPKTTRIPQYQPYRYACDTFEPFVFTRQRTRLAQLYYEGNPFISDLWLQWQDVAGYIDKTRRTLDVRALCNGFQIAPIADPRARGGCYPNRIRVVNVCDRSLQPMAAQTINNPAYGSGLNPLGTLNCIIWLADTPGLLADGALKEEACGLTCENTQVDEELFLRMRALAEWQEHKGRLIDAMYRRETTLAQLEPESITYERSRDILNAKVERLEALIQYPPFANCPRSGYDADLEYLRRQAQCREGVLPDGTPAPTMFPADTHREKSIQSGFAMRSGAQGFALSELYIKPERETAPRAQNGQKMRAANGQWFEQLDMFAAFETKENE